MKPNQTQVSRTALTVACSVALLLALVACGKKDDGKTVGQSVDSGIAKTARDTRRPSPPARLRWPAPAIP